MSELGVALGLVLVIEGLLLAAAPGLVRDVWTKLAQQNPDALRFWGVAALAVGVAIVFFVKRGSGV